MIVLDQPDPKKVQALALRAALRLEAAGLKRRGPTALSIAKRTFGFKGNISSVREQLELWIRENLGDQFAR